MYEFGKVEAALRESGFEIIRHEKGGSEIVCRCKNCSDDESGHLYVNAETGAAHCFVCDIKTHVSALTGLHNSNYAVDVAQDIILKAAANYYVSRLRPEHRAYLNARGIDHDTIHRFQVGWADGELINHLLSNGFLKQQCIDAGLATKA